jgi:hypothetical protein
MYQIVQTCEGEPEPVDLTVLYTRIISGLGCAVGDGCKVTVYNQGEFAAYPRQRRKEIGVFFLIQLLAVKRNVYK